MQKAKQTYLYYTIFCFLRSSIVLASRGQVIHVLLVFHYSKSRQFRTRARRCSWTFPAERIMKITHYEDHFSGIPTKLPRSMGGQGGDFTVEKSSQFEDCPVETRSGLPEEDIEGKRWPKLM